MKKIVTILTLLASMTVWAQQYKCTTPLAPNPEQDYLLVTFDGENSTVDEYDKGINVETHPAEIIGELAVNFTLSTPNGFVFDTTLDVKNSTMTIEMEPYPAQEMNVSCTKL